MRNRFKPNLAPRGSQRTTRASTAETGASSKARTAAKSSDSSAETSGGPQRTVSSAKSGVTPAVSDVTVPDASSTAEDASATAAPQAGPTRRSRIKPSVMSVTRQRSTSGTARKSTKSGETTGKQHAGESDGKGPSETSRKHAREAEAATADPLLQEMETHSQPDVTQEPNAESSQASREVPAQIGSNAMAVVEQTQEQQQPSRRKRPSSNISGPAPRKKQTLSTEREASTNAVQAGGEAAGTDKETPAVLQETSNWKDKEEAQTGKEKTNVDKDGPNQDSSAGATGQEARHPEDRNGTNAKRQTKAKRRRGSRSVKPKEPADISQMTMQDLIYYNPKTNPMKSSVDAKKKIQESRRSSKSRADADSREQNEESAVLEAAPTEDKPAQTNTADEMQTEDSAAMSVAPKVKLAADGSIILDEESLVIHAQEDHSLDNSEIVYEDTNQVNFAAYKKHKKVERWSRKETLVFYKALSQVGTDFSLMGPIFPKRSRRELKAKFKREEKLHRDEIEKALSHRAPIDVELFAPPVEEECDVVEPPAQTKN